MNTNIVDKVVMFLGDSGVGKTSLISQFLELEQEDFKRSRITNLTKERERTICS
jgi:putative ribosome biogenesis GTPase RsgA